MPLVFFSNGSDRMKRMKPEATLSNSEDDRYETFVSCFAHHEPDLRRFIRSLLPTWTDTDEVLQQTAIVIWRKFDQYDPATNFMKWACVIARFESLAYRRKMARDRLVFREDVLELMADEGIEEIDSRRTEHEALEACLLAMPEKQRQFLTLAYTPGVKVKEMAEEAGSSAASFYMRLKRLRRQLMECMESKTNTAGAMP
ncbi:MAG: sigma-70 family RNA polymerase sigma factor [Verrucomicrobiales bacterium]|nr:sigma-70 family RNA polymerase sigma factor [Verrucomicrobiales bacterium]